MKIVDRYIVWEMIPLFLLGIAGFVMIMTVDLIFTFTDLIINKGVPFPAILKLIVYKLPSIMVLTFPVSTLFATTMTLGRLGKDNEITALRTSGVNLLRISLPIIIFASFVSLAAFITNEQVVPYANHVSENIIRQIILKQPLPNIRENVFFKDLGERYFYIKKVNPKTNQMEDLLIYELGEDNFPQVIIAKRASWKDRIWTLEEGIIHKFDSFGHISYETTFSNLEILVSENILNFSNQKTTAEMNSKELGGLISMLKKGGVHTQSLQVDYQMKFSIPLVSLIFALVGIPLSLPPIRTGRSFGIVICVIMIFSYYVFASILRSLGRGLILAPLLAAWAPPLLVGLLGIILITREGIFK